MSETIRVNAMDFIMKNEAITEKDGIPYVLGLPCIKDPNYKFSLAEYIGLTDWLCPHCNSNLSKVNGKLECVNHCHKNKVSAKL
ncbi:MAG: hypothetical protein ACXVPN_11805 [Bacteroidia bacterium]